MYGVKCKSSGDVDTSGKEGHHNAKKCGDIREIRAYTCYITILYVRLTNDHL